MTFHLKDYFVSIFLIIFIAPFTALISCLIYIPVFLLSCFFSNYGKFINYFAVWLDEDFVNSVPQSSIVISLTLQADLSLEELRSAFIKNVLSARSKNNPRKPRYPELMQYLTTFVCFRIWKNDSSFLIENHIVEKSWTGSDLSDIHQEYQNKLYKKERSPWELVLVRNVNINDDTENVPNSLLVFKVHHVMGDARSLQKLLIECLGNKKLKTASPQLNQEHRFDRVLFVVLFPLKLIWAIYNQNKMVCSSLNHPWRTHSSHSKTTVVAFSPKLSMSHVKQVAKRYDVKPSSVVMSIIAGAVRKYCVDKWQKKVAIGYPLPRLNHPEYLTNHMNLSIMNLATDKECVFERLQQCHQEFVRVKENQEAMYTNVGLMLAGLQIYPMGRLFANVPVPICITNNAGDEEGFSVGDAQCIDFRMSVGTPRGSMGIVFCTISYKDVMRIAVVANESILSKKIAHSLAEHIKYELQILIEKA